jgi:hypothetical protein
MCVENHCRLFTEAAWQACAAACLTVCGVVQVMCMNMLLNATLQLHWPGVVVHLRLGVSAAAWALHSWCLHWGCMSEYAKRLV